MWRNRCQFQNGRSYLAWTKVLAWIISGSGSIGLTGNNSKENGKNNHNNNSKQHTKRHRFCHGWCNYRNRINSNSNSNSNATTIPQLEMDRDSRTIGRTSFECQRRVTWRPSPLWDTQYLYPSARHHKVKTALINAGYRVSGFHKDPDTLKTKATNQFVWDIFRSWCKKNLPWRNPCQILHPEKYWPRKHNTKSIFPCRWCSENKFMSTAKNTMPTVGRNESQFPMNPEANWDPKKAASGTKKQKTGEW